MWNKTSGKFVYLPMQATTCVINFKSEYQPKNTNSLWQIVKKNSFQIFRPCPHKNGGQDYGRFERSRF